MKRLIKSTLVLFAILSVASCERKELLEPHSHLNTALEVEVSSNTELSIPPKSVSYVFISNDDGSVVSGTSGTTSGLDIAPGRYKALFYTSDFHELDGIFYRGMNDFSTAEAYTRQASRATTQYNITDPDPLFSKVLTDVEILAATENGGKQVIQAMLDQRSFRYYITIDVEGIEHLRSATLEISGMYTTVFLADGSHREDEVGTHGVEMKLRENSIYGEFWSFGPNQNKDVKNRIVLYFANGKSTVVELDDISDRIKPLTRGGEIKVDQRFVIHEGDGGAGFDPDVGEWDEIDVPIPI